ncbi:ATP-binding cassette domain-containing protein [Vineibacter terrae]|uniref:ATP-binding cassette domain-containing protein n=1 Tax=Vineibacter terrae TaxID=2586908 RepID=A0A5C8PLR9_9HYPH|nr:oligopeptide/dipeptide ABC transporter ATP-binding protein [Vineibacter terrae]TXL75154.1 ATP-binding cassette domain-containing protein [Vineibacter terrae]
MSATTPILSVRDLAVIYPLGGGRTLRAAEDISFDVHPGEALALVGESGCGKSSVARAIMQLQAHTEGQILVDGQDLRRLSRRALKALRPRFQMIFQDPISSLNPRRRVREILEAPLRITGMRDAAARARRVATVLDLVGLDPQAVLGRYPHEFSGGQCQRLSIARALVLEPALLVCDEPVSALDVSVRAQVLNLLNELRERLGLAMLFISHDLAVVRNIADRVAVMYLGRIAEIGAADSIFNGPAHPYTAALLSAVPEPDPDAALQRLPMKSGEIPSPLAPPPGCRFQTRCPAADDHCRRVPPELAGLQDARSAACHKPFVLGPAVRERAPAGRA